MFCYYSLLFVWCKAIGWWGLRHTAKPLCRCTFCWVFSFLSLQSSQSKRKLLGERERKRRARVKQITSLKAMASSNAHTTTVSCFSLHTLTAYTPPIHRSADCYCFCFQFCFLLYRCYLFLLLLWFWWR